MNGLPLSKALFINSDIQNLCRREPASVTEDEMKELLRHYNLLDGLVSIGKLSVFIYNDHSKNKLGKAIYKNPDSGLLVSQFALAYLANMFLISGANDFKDKKISEKENLFGICNAYNHSLIIPLSSNIPQKNFFQALMVRLSFEQIRFQTNLINTMARTYILFENVAQNKRPVKIENLHTLFEKTTGITIKEYFIYSLLVFTAIQETPTFNIDRFLNSDIPHLKHLLIRDKIYKYLNILTASYRQFRTTDQQLNSTLNPIYTKTRFNSLWIYPIIEVDNKTESGSYVIPNVCVFLQKAFGDLYWWFHMHFEKEQKQLEFRDYFGSVFQEYVGLILKTIYPEEQVHEEITYGKTSNRFVDWWITRGDKVYLFEAKSNQFSLLNRQTGDADKIMQNEVKKIADGIEQLHRRVKDIDKYEELKQLRGKRLVCVLVFFDFPFMSSALYDLQIKEELLVREKSKGSDGLSSFEVFRLNIDELESFATTSKQIELEEIFPKYRSDPTKSFLSVVAEESKDGLGNDYLEKAYEDFWNLIDPRAN